MNNNFRSRLKIGNISIDCTQSFTKSQKEHWKDYFGITVEDITDIEAIAIVKTHWLNIRSGAGTNYTQIGNLKYKDKVKIIETKLNFDSDYRPQLWGRIAEEDKKTDRKQEWICLEYCEITGDVI